MIRHSLFLLVSVFVVLGGGNFLTLFDGVSSYSVDVLSTRDGGYINSAAIKYNTGNWNWGILLSKVNKLGNPVWVKIFGALGGSQVGMSLLEMDDESVILCGVTAPCCNWNAFSNLYKNEIIIAKFSGLGTLLWSKKINSDYGRCESITQTKDGQGFVMTGSYSDNIATSSYVYSKLLLAKFDLNGTPLWIKVLDGGYGNGGRGKSVIESSDGSLVIGGTTNRIIGADWYDDVRDLIVAKYSPSGNLVWSRVIAKKGSVESIVESSDGNYTITGFYDDEFWNKKLVVMKLTPTGDVIYTKKYYHPSDSMDERASGLSVHRYYNRSASEASNGVIVISAVGVFGGIIVQEKSYGIAFTLLPNGDFCWGERFMYDVYRPNTRIVETVSYNEEKGIIVVGGVYQITSYGVASIGTVNSSSTLNSTSHSGCFEVENSIFSSGFVLEDWIDVNVTNPSPSYTSNSASIFTVSDFKTNLAEYDCRIIAINGKAYCSGEIFDTPQPIQPCNWTVIPNLPDDDDNDNDKGRELPGGDDDDENSADGSVALVVGSVVGGTVFLVIIVVIVGVLIFIISCCIIVIICSLFLCFTTGAWGVIEFWKGNDNSDQEQENESSDSVSSSSSFKVVDLIDSSQSSTLEWIEDEE